MFTAAELRPHVGLDADDDAHDARLEEIEAGAMSYVERMTGRYYGPPLERVEYLSGHGGRDLWLDEAPAAVPALELEEYSDAVWTVVPAADYELREFKLRHLTWCWRCGDENYRATYTAGYELGDEPPRVRRLVLGLIARWFRNPAALASESIAGHSESFADLVDSEMQDVIDGEKWARV